MLVTFAAFGGGIAAIIAGLFAYFRSRSNIKLSKKLEVKSQKSLEELKRGLQATNDKLKAINDCATHVTKAQFDLEFNIYKEIWEALVDLGNHTRKLKIDNSIDRDFSGFEELSKNYYNIT